MVAYSFYDSDNRVMRYAETLARRGDQVDVIALKKDDTPRQDILHGVKVYRIQEREKNEKSQLTYALRLMRFFFRSSMFIALQHFKSRYDLIHVHNIPDFLVFAALLPKLSGAKIILDIHDVVPELYAAKFGHTYGNLIFRTMLALEKGSCAFSDHVIIANHIWQKTVTDRSVSPEKCSVVLNYPDETIFHPRPRPTQDGKFIMMYPGSLNPRQGVDIAVRAFALVKDRLPAAEFHIYGDGAGRKGLEELVSELGVQDRVLFKGSLPIYEMAERMAQADLGIEPKRNDLFAGDAMSTKILEFMSVGVPVIASDTRVHMHYFNDKVLRFFRNDNPEDLADCITRVFSDDGYRRALIAAGRAFAEDFVWGKKKEEYLHLVDVLVGKGAA